MIEEDPEDREEVAKATRLLVAHLLSMGASSAKIPVVVNDETYLVTVHHVPILP